MSLINKMLRDLETRQHTPLGKPPSRPIFQDLHAVSEKGLQHRLLPILVFIAMGLVLAGAGYFWTQRHKEPTVPAVSANDAMTTHTAPASDVQPQAALIPAAPLETTSELVLTTESAPAPALETAPMRSVLPPSLAVAPPLPASQTQADIAPPVAAPPASVAAVKPSKPRPDVAPATKRAAPVAVAPQDNAASIVANGSMEKKAIPLTPEQTAENSYRAAAQQLQQRQLIEAEAGLKSTLAANPRHVPARELLAGLLLERGRMDAARQVLEQGLASVPGQSGFVTLLARIHVEQGAQDTAVTLLEQQRTLAKSDAETLALLATLYQRSSRHPQAIAAYKDALTLKPQEGKWWVGLGISQEAMQNWAEARFAYERTRDTNIDPRLARYAEQRLAIVRVK